VGARHQLAALPARHRDLLDAYLIGYGGLGPVAAGIDEGAGKRRAVRR
jgi:hypothetical protein